MRVRAIVVIFCLLAGVLPLAGQPQAAVSENPLLRPWTTPFGVPPFNEIKAEHFLPALKQAVAEQRREVEAIVANPAAPTFANTI
ncbi:MAG: hypothetical protein Q7V01_12770, partial [Vicinamibacterales bacterium]|nr:hypothetical protein [Vicinamibacterales bacterium]